MGIFKWILGLLSIFGIHRISDSRSDSENISHSEHSYFDNQYRDEMDIDETVINPASGLPMQDGIGGFDIAGNPYGQNDDDTTDDYQNNSSDFNFSDNDVFETSYDNNEDSVY